QVTAHTVRVDQLEYAGLPANLIVVRRRDIGDPADRFVRDPQRGEDLVVEAVFAQQQLVDAAQKLTRLGALNDAVVVRRRQGHDLADREATHGLLGRALVLRGILHRADADDAA